ncbi:MAG: glycosyltransferase [Bacteroidetes bacterium]|nr:glycosyltransferase [Bacteroidota bacterium]
MPKRILIVTRFFHPDITPRAFRAYELAKEFSRQGHDVTVLTTKREFDYSYIEQRFGFCVQAIVKSEPDQIQGDGLKRVIRFILQWLFLYPSILLTGSFKKSLKHEAGYDLLISIAYPFPVHFGVALAKKKNKALCKTWVADCGDPFVGVGTARLPAPFYFHWLERWFCKKPDYISVPIDEAKPAFPLEYQNKIRVIPQGFDFSEINPNYEKSFNAVPTFAYAGTVSTGPLDRDPRDFLNFLCQLELDFKFIIYTRNYSLVEPYQKMLGKKLEVRCYIPRNELLDVLGKMDFLINFEIESKVQKSSKLIDYALVQRPILSMKPLDIDKIALKEFLIGNYEKQLEIDDIENYNIKSIANKFINLAEVSK